MCSLLESSAEGKSKLIKAMALRKKGVVLRDMYRIPESEKALQVWNTGSHLTVKDSHFMVQEMLPRACRIGRLRCPQQQLSPTARLMSRRLPSTMCLLLQPPAVVSPAIDACLLHVS